MRSGLLTKLLAAGALIGGVAVSGVLALRISMSTGANQLGYADTAEESDPPEVALGIALGAFRGFLVNYLWISANELKEEGKFFESLDKSEMITRLQPRHGRVWAFHAWNQAYNISVVTKTPQERYEWVMSGIRLLRDEGIPKNPNDMLLYRELGWIFQHKLQGYTDDANQYYKREFAREWHEVLGRPPGPNREDGSRDRAIEDYAEWLEKLVSAPDTFAGLQERSPEAAALWQRIVDEGIATEFDSDFLRRYMRGRAIRGSFFYDVVAEAGFSPRAARLDGLLAEEGNEEAWDELLSFVRRRVIIEEYKMSPALMQRYTRRYGPIDWRLPAAHALYWSTLGVEKGLARVTTDTEKAYDFLNTDRMTLQSVQELFRFGQLYFNYDEAVAGQTPIYQPFNNIHFIDTYGEILDELRARGGIPESQRRSRSGMVAGYENFMKDAIRVFYRRGEVRRAEEYQQKIIEDTRRNVHDWAFTIDELSRPIDEFVLDMLRDEDRILNPQVIVSEVTNALYAAFFFGLIDGNTDLFERNLTYAQDIHQYYFDNQTFDSSTGTGVLTRMAYLDRNFRFVQGLAFRLMMESVGLDEARRAYFNAPSDLKNFGYIALEPRFRAVLAQAAENDPDSPTFDELFPPEPTLPAFRVEYAEYMERRNADVRRLGDRATQ